MVIQSDTESDNDLIGKLVNMMYDKPPSKLQTPLSFPGDSLTENAFMEGDEGITFSVELNAPLKRGNQSK